MAAVSGAGQVLAILFGFGFTIAACYAAGRILLARFQLNLYKEEVPLFAFLTGSACVSLAVFALAAAGLVQPWLFLTMGAAILLVAIRQSLPRRVSPPPLPVFWKYIFVMVFLAYTVLYWSHAMEPAAGGAGLFR